MINPKTTLAGYLAFLGLVLAGLGQMFPGKASATVSMVGLGLSGAANALGNIASKDGGI